MNACGFQWQSAGYRSDVAWGGIERTTPDRARARFLPPALSSGYTRGYTYARVTKRNRTTDNLRESNCGTESLALVLLIDHPVHHWSAMAVHLTKPFYRTPR
jgi:hypothetical protein